VSGLVAGQATTLLPGLVRVVAPNASFMTGAGTNSYLLGGRAGAILVDPGPDDAGHRARLLEAAPGPIRYVLVTHHHADHAPGAAAVAALEDARVLARGRAGRFEPDDVLGEGDRVAVPGWGLAVLETPGHASDHLCFLAAPEPARAPPAGSAPTGGPTPPLLLSGDHVLGGTTVVVPPPDGDMGDYLTSLRRLLELEPPIGAILPGHGEVIGEPRRVLADYLSHRLEREQQVLAALRARRTARPEELVDDIYTTRPGPLHRAAELSVWAHLRKLAADGLAESPAPEDPAGEWVAR